MQISSGTDDYRVYSSCWVAVTVVVACRLTHHLFCLPVLAVSCRIVLVCAKRSLYAAFSVLPYGESAHLRYKESTNPSREHPPLAFMFFFLSSSLLSDPWTSSSSGKGQCVFVCVCVKWHKGDSFWTVILSWRFRDKGCRPWWLLTCSLPSRVWSWGPTAR